MSTELFKILAFIAASTVTLAIAIFIAGRTGRDQGPRTVSVFALAGLISALGIPFGKYGQNFGLPWQIYYTLPALATVLAPPIVFRFSLPRSLGYIAAAFTLAPLIHAAFSYGLGWPEYMPFLKLPR